ncbi:PREDICTED: smad nuclear-interacting protein 1 [Trachymyrmex cornetzi]|uniref:Smad nuclear-interacting protein 1 n=1 Tax=Trachymyrmex cornetzi TaxID=471704 RepID=A0A195E5B3_9HYME|nr:PREDICTED: smad nuclear-interacting protein 1 [Trachymyrmex cornetzi]KYN20348.1 Smad nuclear-interacting protein 1 [Trachymyrmex cornetzi]
MSNWRSSHAMERRDTYKNNREIRRDRSNETYRDRSQRSRDRDHRSGRRDHSRRDDEKQNDKRKHERSPLRRENSHPRHRERNERSRSRDRRDDSSRRRNDQHKQKRSPEETRMKRESSTEWGKSTVKEEKEKPNFELSGKLTEDMNTVNGVVIKYSEPLDAKKPKRRWRLYPFKGEKALPTLYIHRQSAYLMGRDRKVADIPLDHPSCSKQHAALQYRLVSYQKEGGVEGRRIRPYIIDLESANGTFVNNVKLEPRRYHELLEKDVVRFGFSTREYVLLHEHSKDDSFDDDVPLTNET